MLRQDPESAFLMKEQQRQIREVQQGRLKIEDATALPEGSRLERGRVVMPGDKFFFILTAIIFIPLIAALAFWLFNNLINLAISEYAKPSAVSYILIPIIALIAGIVFHWVRDHLNLRAYAVAEIGIGMATAALFVKGGDPLSRVLAFLAGVRIIVDGTSRFLKFTGLQWMARRTG